MLTSSGAEPVTVASVSASASPVSASIGQKELVKRLRAFAQDPKHQSALISNADCLRTICEVLSTAIDTETCVIALQTLTFLAANPKHRPVLSKVPKLLARIDLLMKSKHSKISILAGNLRDTMASMRSMTGSRMRLSSITGAPTATTAAMEVASASVRAFEPRSLHTVYLRITNMRSAEDREGVQKAGISVSGVISVSANVDTQNATFYCTLPAATVKPKIIHALRAQGFVSMDESRTEARSVLMSPRPSRESESKSGEDASAVRRARKESTGPLYKDHSLRVDADTAHAITKYVADPSVKTLRERLAEDKRKREAEVAKKKEEETWIATVVSYVW